MFKQRQKIREMEILEGISDLSEAEKSIFAFIKSKEFTNITEVTKEVYFKDMSLSTVKRSIKSLVDHNLVEKTKIKDDQKFGSFSDKRCAPLRVIKA